MSGSSLAKLVRRTLFVVGFLLSITSLLNYFEVFTNQGLYSFLEVIVSKYRSVVQAVFGFLDEPLIYLVNVIADLFNIRVDVQKYWKDLFIPVGLYFTSAAQATHGESRKAYRRTLYACGVAIALLFSVVLATLGADLTMGPALATLAASVVFYELTSYGLMLLLVDKAERASSPRFFRYFVERPLSSVALALLTGIVASIEFTNDSNAAELALVFFILMLGIRSMLLAILFAAENRGRWPGTFKERLFRSRSWVLGASVVVIIVVATLGVVWGG